MRATRPLILLITLALGALCLLPCLGMVGGIGMFALERGGRLSKWESLGASPAKPIEIIAADVDLVFVASEDGRIFGCDHLSERKLECWYPVSQVPKLDPGIRTNTPIFTGQVPPPPGVPVSQLHVTHRYGELLSETYYAILTDGTVWKREYDLIGLFPLLGNLLVGLIIGGMIGILLAIAIALVGGGVAFERWLRARKVSHA